MRVYNYEVTVADCFPPDEKQYHTLIEAHGQCFASNEEEAEKVIKWGWNDKNTKVLNIVITSFYDHPCIIDQHIVRKEPLY